MTMLDEFDVDVVVAGSGVGGLMAAYYAQRAGSRVALLGGSGGASRRISSMNTALGYDENDTPAGLFDDMLKAGGHINSVDVVAAIVDRIPDETRHLLDLGVPFARSGDSLKRRQAAGSAQARAVFSDGMIGVDIARVLRRELESNSAVPMIDIKGGIALDLQLRTDGTVEVLGYNSRDRRWLSIRAGSLVMATGGAGQLFGTTTNPRGSRGIGYAMALEAGAELVDMEFVSFEPFVTSGSEPLRDLPTTVLREGAKLRNGLGAEFMDTTSAPSKDVICRAMVREVTEGRGTESGSVYFDLREMDPDVANRYVQIVEALRSLKISSREAQLEVMPAQHFLMGGIEVDPSGASSLPGLYAVGEVAGGVHAAHRLAAGGGLEVVAGGAIAGESAARHAGLHKAKGPRAISRPRPELLGTRLTDSAEEEVKGIQEALQRGCGIVRNGDELARSVAQLDDILDRSRGHDAFVHRGALVASSIARSALMRNESRGDHYRVDYPSRNDMQWLANLHVTLADGELDLRYERVAKG